MLKLQSTVGVLVGVLVNVNVGVFVGVSVGVSVAVNVGVGVGVLVDVNVGVGVNVGVAVGNIYTSSVKQETFSFFNIKDVTPSGTNTFTPLPVIKLVYVIPVAG